MYLIHFGVLFLRVSNLCVVTVFNTTLFFLLSSLFTSSLSSYLITDGQKVAKAVDYVALN